MHQEAIAAAKQLIELEPLRGYPLLALAYLAAGEREQALTIVPKMPRKTRFNLVGQVYLALGDKDTALRELESAYKAHESTVPWVRARGYGWDSMHDDPRFQDLVRRMNLPQGGQK